MREELKARTREVLIERGKFNLALLFYTVEGSTDLLAV